MYHREGAELRQLKSTGELEGCGEKGFIIR